MASYLSVKSKFPIQGYTQRMDHPIEKMGVPFLPLGVEETRRGADSDPVMHTKGRKVRSQLKNSGGFHLLTDVFSWLQYVFEEQLRGELAKAKLMGYERWIVELISWKVSWKGGACSHFATTMTKFGEKNAGLDEGIKNCSRRLIRTA